VIPFSESDLKLFTRIGTSKDSIQSQAYLGLPYLPDH